METKELEKIVNESLTGYYEKHKASILEEVGLKSYQSKDEVEAAIKAVTDKYDADIVALKKSILEQAPAKPLSFKQMVKAGLEGSRDSLVALKNKGSKSHSVMLTKANEDLDPANFLNDSYAVATTETRGLRETPFRRTWLRDLLPNGSISGGVLQYLKESGNVGAAGVWDGTGPISELSEKPGTAPIFDLVTKNVIWIAGVTRVKREMLDDINWLQGYLSRRLISGRTGLFVAENTQILTALDTNSTPYDGSETDSLKIMVDAAAQLSDNGYDGSFYLMNSRDVTKYVVFTQNGSLPDNFNLPSGIVAIINGRLHVNGIPVYGLPTVPSGEVLLVDSNETEFISRMTPEIRFSEEDRDNFVTNLVTVRAEERILPVVYDSAAIIKMDLTPTT